jgi:hypothetical protein
MTECARFITTNVDIDGREAIAGLDLYRQTHTPIAPTAPASIATPAFDTIGI